MNENIKKGHLILLRDYAKCLLTYDYNCLEEGFVGKYMAEHGWPYDVYINSIVIAGLEALTELRSNRKELDKNEAKNKIIEFVINKIELPNDDSFYNKWLEKYAPAKYLLEIAKSDYNMNNKTEEGLRIVAFSLMVKAVVECLIDFLFEIAFIKLT